MPVLVQELLTLYAHHGDAGVLPPATPYRNYLAWLAGQDRAAAIAAWREELSAGLDEADAGRTAGSARAPIAAPEQALLRSSEPLTAALTPAARAANVTLNTLVQACWGLLLGRLTARTDVVFGVTVAGRPPEIAGIERMVGLFINTLPLRIKLPPEKPLLELMRRRAGWPVAVDGAPASRAGRNPEPRRPGRAVRHLDGVRELSGRP